MKRLLLLSCLFLALVACKESETFPSTKDIVGVWEYQRIEPNAFSQMDTIDYTLHFYNVKEVRAIIGVYEDTSKISNYYQDYEFELRYKDSQLKLKELSSPEDLPLDSGVVSKIYPLYTVHSLETNANRTQITVGPFLDSLNGTTASFTFLRKE